MPSKVEIEVPDATGVEVTEDYIEVKLRDGRIIGVPLDWYPRLAHGKPGERRNWRLIGTGEGIHWYDLDEDLSVEALLAGRRSGESQASLKRWLGSRTR